MEDENEMESYIMLLLADGNLPTGSFVASSGFESYVKHGFFNTFASSHSVPASTSSAARTNQAVLDFVKDSLGAYSRSALPFVSDTHTCVEKLLNDGRSGEEVLKRVEALDELYHSMTVNDVTRRSSKAQGVALLTLFSKGFSRPDLGDSMTSQGQEKVGRFVDELKLRVRREDTHGHLPICWGVLTAALGLKLERSQHLHLFLQARSLLSAAIRLNSLGPYAAQQLLLHSIRPLVASEFEACKHLRTGLREGGEVDDGADGPANAWPLGEILMARHDLQHSRIFNS